MSLLCSCFTQFCNSLIKARFRGFSSPFKGLLVWVFLIITELLSSLFTAGRLIQIEAEI